MFVKNVVTKMFSDLPPRLEKLLAPWLYISSLTINSFIIFELRSIRVSSYL